MKTAAQDIRSDIRKTKALIKQTFGKERIAYVRLLEILESWQVILEQ